MPGHSNTPKNVNICVFGADWCGFTTKQIKTLKDHEPKALTEYGEYIDCSKPDAPPLCKQLPGYPQTFVVEGDCRDIDDASKIDPKHTFAGWQKDAHKITDAFHNLCDRPGERHGARE